MTQAPLAKTSPAPPGAPQTTLATRFGAVAVEPKRLISFEGGLLGFTRHRDFVLTEIPGRDVAFKLLQALDDPELGFVVLPLDPDRGPIARPDLEAAARALALPFSALAVLAVITLRSEPDGVRCTANLRAPLLLDTERRLGWQYVLASDAYAIRHQIQPGNGR